MNSINKKAEVLEFLSQTKDSHLIDEVYDMLHPETAIEDANVSSMPDELKQKINRALDDYKNGNYITHEEMQQKVQQWLTK